MSPGGLRFIQYHLLLPYLIEQQQNLTKMGLKNIQTCSNPKAKNVPNIYLCVFPIQFVGKGREINPTSSKRETSHFSPILPQFIFSSRWSSLRLNWMQPVFLFTVLIYSLAASCQSFSYLCFQLNVYFSSSSYCQGVHIALLYLCICFYVFNYLNNVQCVFCTCIHVIVQKLEQF